MYVNLANALISNIDVSQNEALLLNPGTCVVPDDLTAKDKFERKDNP